MISNAVSTIFLTKKKIFKNLKYGGKLGKAPSETTLHSFRTF